VCPRVLLLCVTGVARAVCTIIVSGCPGLVLLRKGLTKRFKIKVGIVIVIIIVIIIIYGVDVAAVGVISMVCHVEGPIVATAGHV